MGCFIEQINGRYGSLGEHMVVQSGVHLVHVLHLQSDVEGLRQSCDLDVVTLHGHGLHFLQGQNETLREVGGGVGWVSAALAFRIMATCAAGRGGCSSQAQVGTGADTHLSRKQHSHRQLGLQKRNLNHFYFKPLRIVQKWRTLSG